MHPPRSCGNCSKITVERHARQEDLGRHVDRHVILGANVLAAAEEVGDRFGVVVEGTTQRAPASTDVQHERHAALFEQCPERMIVRVKRRFVLRWRRRHVDGAAPQVDGLLRLAADTLRITPRDEAHRDESLVVRAEVRHRAVVRPRAAVEEIRIVAGELAGGEGAEDELPVDAEEIDGAAALNRIKRTECRPPLCTHDVVFQRPRRERIATSRLRSSDSRVGQRPGSAEIQRPDAFADAGIGVLDEPISQLHEVAVRVVVSPAFGICPVYPPLNPTRLQMTDNDRQQTTTDDRLCSALVGV